MIIKKLNIATTLTLLTFFNNCNATNCIYIEDSFLGLETYHNLQKKITKNDDICFKNIPGGLASMLVKYSRIIEGKKVHVYGYCNSLCADLALSADRLFLHKSNDAKNPSYMVIHGSFNMKNETWDPSSLDNVEYYFDRFKIIEKTHNPGTVF